MTGNKFINELCEGRNCGTCDIIYKEHKLTVNLYHNYCEIYNRLNYKFILIMDNFSLEDTETCIDLLLNNSLIKYKLSSGIIIEIDVKYKHLEIDIFHNNNYSKIICTHNNLMIREFLIKVKSTFELLSSHNDLINEFLYMMECKLPTNNKFINERKYRDMEESYPYIHKSYNCFVVGFKKSVIHMTYDLELYIDIIEDLLCYHIGLYKISMGVELFYAEITLSIGNKNEHMYYDYSSLPLYEFLTKAKSVFELIGPNIGDFDVFDNFTHLMNYNRLKNAAK